MIPLGFLPNAVATGNAFVLEPCEKVPLSSQLIYEAVDEVGFPMAPSTRSTAELTR